MHTHTHTHTTTTTPPPRTLTLTHAHSRTHTHTYVCDIAQILKEPYAVTSAIDEALLTVLLDPLLTKECNRLACPCARVHACSMFVCMFACVFVCVHLEYLCGLCVCVSVRACACVMTPILVCVYMRAHASKPFPQVGLGLLFRPAYCLCTHICECDIWHPYFHTSTSVTYGIHISRGPQT